MPAWPHGSATDVVSAINAATAGADGLSLLHRAVRSGSAAMVDGLLSFGCSQGFCWRVRAAPLLVVNSACRSAQGHAQVCNMCSIKLSFALVALHMRADMQAGGSGKRTRV